MNKVTPWQERFTDGMAVAFNDQLKAMQAEIDELRAALAAQPEQAATCKQHLLVHTGWVTPKDYYAVPVLFNPYTGEPRDVRDVQSDPQGILIVPPGKVEMLAAHPPAQPASAWRDIESAPNGTMLIFANMSPKIQAQDWCFVGWLADGKMCGHRMDKPTHWMPIPTPPSEGL